MPFRPKEDLCLENPFSTDGFLLFFPTQGDTPSSFTLGYKYFAHTGLNLKYFSFFQFSVMGCIFLF
jgi:hypothetical protein